MSPITCGTCSREIATSEAYELNGKVYCGACAESSVQAAAQSGQSTNIIRLVD
jgi:hypothetical protein